MKTIEFSSIQVLKRSDLKNVKGASRGSIGRCLEGPDCFFEMRGGITAYGFCTTNSQGSCVCNARENYGESVVTAMCNN